MNEQSIGIFTTDVNLTVRSWDSWLVAMTGLPAEVVKEVKLLEIFPDLAARGIHLCFQRILTQGGVEKLAPPMHPYLVPCVPSLASKYFEYMQQQVTIIPLRNRDQIIGAIVTIEDITAQLEREQELSDLGKQLKSADELQRLRATQQLATQEETEETQRLLEALSDDSWRVRQVAVESLAQRGDASAVAILVSKIQYDHRDMSLLNSALKVLTQMKGDIVTPLTALLQLPDADLRGYVALALGDQRDRRAIPVLINALNDENLNVRYNTIEALGKLRAGEAIEVLASIAESGDFFLAFPALDALKRIGEPEISSRLIPLLADELLCEPVIEVLGQLGNDSIIAPLTDLLNQAQAPVMAIAQAIALLYDRYEEFFDEGRLVANQVRNLITTQGMHNLLETLNVAQETELRALALVLGWLEGREVEQALAHLLGRPTAQREVVKALVRYGPRIGDLLIAQLGAEDKEVRRAAMAAIERLGDRRAVPALVRILTEETDENLIIAAANALTRIGDPQAFEVFLKFLGHRTLAVRQAAVAALNSLNHPLMAEQALSLLQNSNPYVRESAVRILGYIGQSESLELLLGCCQDPDESVRQAVMESLPYFDYDKCVIPTLARALAEDTPKVRASAARAFAEIESPSVLSYLREAVKDSEAWVRYFAIRSLGIHQDVESVEALSQVAWTDRAHQVRIAAIEALGNVGQVKAVAILAPLSRSEDENLANAALEALGKIHHPEALTPLLVAIQAPGQATRIKAIKALEQHRDSKVVTLLQEVVTTQDETPLVQVAIESLVQIATPEAIQALTALTANPKRREACVDALAQLGEAEVEWIAAGLKHQHVGVRSAVVDALTRMKHPNVLTYLIPALGDKEASIRLATVTAFGRLKHLEGIEAKLLEITHQDPNLAVRRAAQNVLKRMG